MKKILVLMLLWSNIFWAQNVEIAGKITGQDNNPIVGAVVKIVENQRQTTSNLDGEFRINVNVGTYRLHISYTGYKDYETKIVAQRYTYLNVKLQPETTRLDEVIISAVKAGANTPVTYSNVGKKALQDKNLGQDVPYLLDLLPSVVTTSDAGAGVGYTGIRIRGISPQQINVTLNGIPLNDPESHGVYWVDIPDFAGNTQSIQVQRGVGTSTFGTGAFGASINLETDRINKKAYALLQTSYGSFNTLKYSAKASTGLLDNHFEFTGRFSKITSDGYIDRAKSNLKSYYFSGAYKDKKNSLKALVFGGAEKTYQAWYGVDKYTFDNDPTFNGAGAIYNNDGEVTGFYDNEIDDYKQDHIQLHYSRKLGDNMRLNLASHYTYGRGFYEQYKQDRDFSDYGLTPLDINGETIDKTDLIRRKWLDNDFYGWVASFYYKGEMMDFTLGVAGNKYDGRHFGRVIWAQFASDSKIRHEYYRNTGVKKSTNAFVKTNYSITDDLNLFADVQFRKIDYNVNGTVDWQTPWKVSDKLFFINPKIGLFYTLNANNRMYASFAQTHREPNRDDYENAPNGEPKPETLNDFEAGWKYKAKNFRMETNVYAMMYRNQLVLTGKINDVGSPIRENVGKSSRMGVEIQAGYVLNKYVSAKANMSLSKNQNVDYKTTDGTNITHFGNTALPYAPNVIAGGVIQVKPLKNLDLQFLSKYVGKQYMDSRNIEASQLDAYFVENIFANYHLGKTSFMKSIDFTLQVNNILNKKYASNGYMWGDTPYYFPQAGTNYLAGLRLQF